MFSRMTAMLLGIVSASFLPISEGAVNGLLTPVPLLVSAVMGLLLGYFLPLQLRLLSLAFVCGVIIAVHGAYFTQQSMLLAGQEQELTEIEGIVTGLPRTEFRYGKRLQLFEMNVTRTRWAISNKPLRRVKMSWATEKVVEAGQHWRLRAKMKRPRGFANPGGMDYQLYLHQQRIDATGYARWGEQIEPQTSAWKWHGELSELRARLGRALDKNTSHLNSSRFIRALAIGDGAALSADDWQVLNRTGTTHLFVISGLHVGTVAAMSFFLALQLCRLMIVGVSGANAFDWAAVTSLLFASAYAALAGFSIPTQRAVLMLLLFVIARQLGRHFRLSNVLLFAALALAIWQPLTVRSPGYWLSFIAVAALLFAHAHRLSLAKSRLFSVVKVQLVCTVALLPPLMVFFQSASLLMPAINLLVVPVVSVLVVPLVLLITFTVAMSLSPPPMLLESLDKVVSTLWQFLETGSTIANHGGLISAAPTPLHLVSSLLLAFYLIAPAAVRKPFLLLLPLCSLPFLSVFYQASAEDATRVDCPIADFAVLDVGQGLSVVFSTMGRTLVFDTGTRFSESFDAGSGVVAPYLRARGHSVIDTLVLSHEDLDHAGGYPGLREQLPIRQVYASYELPAADFLRCEAGTQWYWNSIKFEFLSPGVDGPDHLIDRNNGSCVLMISAPGFRILLPGDIESEAEQELVERFGAKLKADILVMPHHGSNTSSGEKFLSLTKASYAIASAAYKGRFRHPNINVLDRYKSAGASVLNTAELGAIEFRLRSCKGPFAAEPIGFRERWGNYWLAW